MRPVLLTYFAVAIGGAIGSLLRFTASLWLLDRLGAGFPWGTLGINVLGSFLMGVLFVAFTEHWQVSPAIRYGLVAGLLGGFTTFSTFSIETLQLLQADAWLKATGYMLASVFLCVGGAGLGYLMGRQWLG
jgi:CrcB protein